MRKLGIVVMVVLALVLDACTSSVSPTTTTVPTTTRPLPVIDLSATPTGWVPVADGDVQISVPATWWVLYNSCPTGSPPGEVLVNPANTYCPAFGQGGPKNVVWLVSRSYAGFRPSSSDKRSVINGFSVYDDRGTYFVPSLGLQVTLSGPLAQRVLHTLSRSPRAVALAPGPAPVVPSSWRTVTFAGLRFSVPPAWPVDRSQVTPGLGGICRTPGVAFLSTMATLSTDARPYVIPKCLQVPATQQPKNGFQVDSGSRTEPQVTLSFSNHCLNLGGLTACPATSPAYSILVLKVTVPGRNKPVYVSIGLAGNGIVARTILYSLRAATPSEALGSVTGSFVAVGGAAPGLPRPLPGQVTAKNAAGHRFTVTVGKRGKFVLSLPAGVYQLTGRSPMVMVNGVEATCVLAQPVRVRAGKETRGVQVICPLK